MENIDWGHLLFKFDGRINRAKYWLGIAGIYVISWVLLILAISVNSVGVWFIVSLVMLAMIWPGLAVSIKRWHDRGKSGWWILIGLIPLVGFWWVLIECGFLEGTVGDNEYGPNPLEA